MTYDVNVDDPQFKFESLPSVKLDLNHMSNLLVGTVFYLNDKKPTVALDKRNEEFLGMWEVFENKIIA